MNYGYVIIWDFVKEISLQKAYQVTFMFQFALPFVLFQVVNNQCSGWATCISTSQSSELAWEEQVLHCLSVGNHPSVGMAGLRIAIKNSQL
jgi:hypothetical protein